MKTPFSMYIEGCVGVWIGSAMLWGGLLTAFGQLSKNKR